MSSTITINQLIPIAFATSGFNTFDQGWNDRERKALSTYVNGGTYNGDCDLAKQTVTYCQGYKIGYNVGWANALIFN
jgi:hypothetical protein